MVATSSVTDAVEVTENSRPVVNISNSLGMSEADFLAWVSSLPHQRGTPITLEAAALLRGRNSQPIVANSAMCSQIGGTDGGSITFSPKALVRDKYYDLVVTATGSLTLTTGAPTGVLSIAALDRTLQKGFVLKFGASNWAALTQAASAGDTTLHLQVLYPDIYGSLVIASTNVAVPLNGLYYQGGTPGPAVENYTLVGRANPFVSVNNWSAMKYSCDGLASGSMGLLLRDFKAQNFPGHGIWMGFPLDPRSRVNSGETPWDNPEIVLDGINRVSSCLGGVSLLGTDTKIPGSLIIRLCRDYGFRVLGSAAQGGTVHAYGCGGWGIQITLGNYFDHLESENCDYGISLEGNAVESQLRAMRAFGNKYIGARILASFTQVGAINILHASAATDGNGSFPTGMALMIGSFSQVIQCPMVRINCQAGASGIRFGTFTVNTMNTIQLGGSTRGTSGCPKGLGFGVPMNNCDISMEVGGFDTDLYFENGSSLAGSRLRIFGATNSNIRWPDGTTGTYQTPNVPSALASSNDIKFLVV